MPSTLPEKVTLYGKMETRIVDFHEMYRNNHRRGWHLMIEHYIKNKHPHYAEDLWICETGYGQSTRAIGSLEAQLMIRQLSLEYNDKTLYNTIRNEYQK